MRLAKLLLCLSAIMLLMSCGSSIMMTAKALDAADENYALVTFLRPSMFGGAIQFGIWDGEEFVGVLSSGKSIQYKAAPGEHIFFGRAENWACVKANVEAGKSYFILAKPIMGLMKARVSLDPLNKGDETPAQVMKWAKELERQTVIPAERDGYIKPRLKEVKAALKNYQDGKVEFLVLEASDNW